MDCIRCTQNPVYYCKFRHIQAYSRPFQPYYGIFRTLCNSSIFRTLPYLKSWHIQNQRYIQKSVKAYCNIFTTLCNAHLLRTLPELCHIQNFGIFWTRGILRALFIQAYSGISNNDSYNNTNFAFFTLILHTFQLN